MVKTARKSGAKPPIHISETDYDLISNHALRLEAKAPLVAKMLLDEMNRAYVHPADQLPKGVVTLGSTVTFAGDDVANERRVKIVLPGEADIESGSLSILSQVGAGLIGLKAGQSINWPCPDGRPRTLHVISVEPPVEATEPNEIPRVG